jgi:DnaK suppressor protein
MSVTEKIKRSDKMHHRKAALKAKLGELTQSPQNRDDLVIETTADVIDFLQQAADREIAVDTVNRNFEILRDVQFALKTIDTGEYGICLECGQDIPARRLDAIPWARYCVSCQQLRERDQDDSDHGWVEAA